MRPLRENGHEEPVIRDNRKIDPETGEVRVRPEGHAPEQDQQQAPPEAGQSPAAAQSPGEEELRAQLEERTADLQRVQAEYQNYRRRVERDRVAVREAATASVLAELLPVLDDIGRAREHGELTGGFAKVAESLESALTKLGLSSYGQKGEPFDPTIHEALMHSYSADVTEPTAVEVLQLGYRMGERILRPARVAVAEPAEDAPASDDNDN